MAITRTGWPIRIARLVLRKGEGPLKAAQLT